MSTIAVNAITDANGGATTTINSVTPNANNVIGKNLIINGAMQIAQRGTSFTGLTNDAYTLDRWQFAVFGSSGHGTYSISQENSVTPDGFGSSIKIDCTTADTSLASDVAVVLRQRLEGQNLQLFQYATSNAKDVTLSFWVRSNLTGTGVVNLYNVDANKHAGATYTINSSNTWERKTVTIAGDTSSGFDNNNGNSLEVRFFLAAGTDFSSGTQVNTWSSRTSANDATDLTLNIGSSSSNAIYITGVQLEVGDAATEFEHRPYGTELQMCERYYQRTGTIRFLTMGRFNVSTGQVYNWWPLSPVMRAAPTVTNDGNFRATSGYTGALLTTVAADKGIRLVSTNNAAANAILYANEGEMFIDAEL